MYEFLKFGLFVKNNGIPVFAGRRRINSYTVVWWWPWNWVLVVVAAPVALTIWVWQKIGRKDKISKGVTK